MIFKSFMQNVYAFLIMGFLFALSLALNGIFTTFRDEYLKKKIHLQIIADVIYFFILLTIFLVIFYLYKGSFDIQNYVLKTCQ